MGTRVVKSEQKRAVEVLDLDDVVVQDEQLGRRSHQAEKIDCARTNRSGADLQHASESGAARR